MTLRVENVLQAYRWKLGLSAVDGSGETWDALQRERRGLVARLNRDVADRFYELYLAALRRRVRLGLPTTLPVQDVAMMERFVAMSLSRVLASDFRMRFLERRISEKNVPQMGRDAFRRRWEDPDSAGILGLVWMMPATEAAALDFRVAVEAALAGPGVVAASRMHLQDLAAWCAADAEHSVFIARAIGSVVKPRKKGRAIQAGLTFRRRPAPLAAVEATRTVERPAAMPVSPPPPALPAEEHAPATASAAAVPVAEGPASPSAPVAVAPAAPALGEAGAWLDLPPAETLDAHETSFATRLAVGHGTLVGARVRGKKHKHEATHCDDWFEVASAGDWAIVAVSDGAGSKLFSRVGARVACRAAAARLVERLEGFHVGIEAWSADVFARDAVTGCFTHPDLEHVGAALVEAAGEAVAAVERASAERAGSLAHAERLGRAIAPSDMSCTLVLAVHARVRSGEAHRNFGMGLQVGDGMAAVAIEGGRLQLLGTPDSGQFSGETEFITSARCVTPEALRGRVVPFLAPLRALMVMTDGVADDYFPNDPDLLRLYGDLVVNGVLGVQAGSLGEQDEALRAAGLPSLDALAGLAAFTPGQYTDASGVRRDALLRSFGAYAEAAGLGVADAAAVPAVLAAGALGPAVCAESAPEERLRAWLDAYQVRGSFDDRTLVVFHPEA